MRSLELEVSEWRRSTSERRVKVVIDGLRVGHIQVRASQLLELAEILKDATKKRGIAFNVSRPTTDAERARSRKEFPGKTDSAVKKDDSPPKSST